jgi:hypothetical protein
MDFSGQELKVLLQALYRFRGEVSGASQSEQNQLELVNSVIGKIEGKAGPLTAERSSFDREMAESLSVLATGRIGAAKAAAGKSAPPAKTAATKAAATQKATAPKKTATPNKAAKKTRSK